MRKTIKYFLSTFVFLAATCAFFGFAKAADITAGNDTTGAGSENEASVGINQSAEINIENNATVSNQINISANTGGNTANCNTGSGQITTGDVSSELSITSSLNRVSIGDLGSQSGGSLDLYNEMTGAWSENEVRVDYGNEQEINIDNDANIDNDIDIDANTGDNEANRNLGDGIVETGDISTDVELISEANNVSIEGAFGEGDIDLTAGNSSTGCESENEIDVEINREEEIDIDNDLNVDNDFDLHANTGDNEANCNGEDGIIETGDVDTSVEYETRGNVVELSDVGFGGSIDAQLSNDTTGAYSENEVDLEIDQESEIDIDNDAEVDNDFDVCANTGDNEAERNLDSGIIETGDIDVDASATTIVNVIALSGRSEGDISIDAENYRTGYGSENEIEIDLENETSIDIDNDLDVDNDFDLHANTGDNEANCNGEDGIVETGDIGFDASVDTEGNIVDLSDFNSDSEIDIEAINEMTGCDSENEVEITQEECDEGLELDIDNCSDLSTEVDVDFEAGDNEANGNCEEGVVETGDQDYSIEIAEDSNLTGDTALFPFPLVHELETEPVSKVQIIENGVSVL